jgi:cytochrome c oxidase subunit 2
MALLVFALRRRPGPIGGEVDARRWIVGGGVVFPVLVLSLLLIYANWRTSELTGAPHRPEAMVISVTAKSWWWEVRYRHPASGDEIVLANEIRLPTGRPLTLALTSSDVIHSFWVPALAGKVDMLPGRMHHLQIQLRDAGVYRGQCAEFCGAQHARMALHVVALAPDAFDRWLDAQAQPAAQPTDPLAQQGRQAFLDQRCNACHTIRGIAGDSRLGPDLTHVGSRMFIGAGTLPTHRGTLAGWIGDTQGIKPGARMPSPGRVDGDSLHALAVFLEQLK